MRCRSKTTEGRKVRGQHSTTLTVEGEGERMVHSPGGRQQGKDERGAMQPWWQRVRVSRVARNPSREGNEG